MWITAKRFLYIGKSGKDFLRADETEYIDTKLAMLFIHKGLAVSADKDK